jgi:predicted HicB family RNase H-like nuclease
MKLLKYKGYFGSFEASIEDNCLFGKLEFIRSLVTFEGVTVQELERAFKEAVDSYLETCKTQKVEPEKPLKGNFNVRIGQERHIAAAVTAKQIGKNLNQFVSIAIDEALQKYG